jgi:radical SAM superfamily enzyme YgiQ (UPF0313 family)
MPNSILFSYHPTHVIYNHGCSLLTAICKNAGIDADYEPLWPGWFEKMTRYDIIGFSFVCGDDYLLSVPYMKAAKAIGKEILAGGVYARRGAYIDLSLVDHICRGEAEIIDDYIWTGDTSVFEKPYYQESIDGLSMPDLSHVCGFEFHRGLPFLKGARIIPYQTSRGCPYLCNFCEVQFQPKGVRMKHTIAQDLTKLNDKYGPDLFFLMDELPPYYSEEWRDQWKDIYFPFHAYIRADIKPEHLEFLIDHGMKIAGFGVESGDERYRNEVLKKNLTDFELFRTVKMLEKRNVLYIPFYMGDMPGETEKEKQATMDMIPKVGGYALLWQYRDLKANSGR